MIKVGSARHDENGKYVNGKAGDQTGTEVSMQDMYNHSKGWYILRLKDAKKATELATAMMIACNNDNIGYDQNQRLGVITNGIQSQVKTEADCSSLVRACLAFVGIQVGNFTTANEASMLLATGLFESRVKYVSQAKTPVYDGDVLVTCTKGHTVIVVSGNPRDIVNPLFYPKYTGNSFLVDGVLRTIGVPEKYLGNYKKRKPVAEKCGIYDYSGSYNQNMKLVQMAKNGQIPRM